jgi:hypothetical protein
MNFVVESVYTFIEICVMIFFVSMYFKPKPLVSAKLDSFIIFLIVAALEIFVSVFNLHWLITLGVSIAVMFAINTLFYKGNVAEHIIIAFLCIFLLALSDVCALTILSKFLGINYNELVENNNISRLLAVLSSKSLYLIIISFILFFKKKYRIFLNKHEMSLILISLVLSGIEMSILRNIIYDSKAYYNLFITILLCVVSMNIVIYYIMIHIGKKNIEEKNYSLMKKQLELQEENIKNLESKYNETIKLRHDFKNYITCALEMSEKYGDTELTKFLQELSDEKINNITSYVTTKREVIGAVLNSKISKAKTIGADMQCYVFSELENISDLDIGIILANLIDNALEASERNNGKSEIFLKTWTDAGYYFMELTNTVENDVLSENPVLKTSKKDKELHGVGLRSVKDIVEKYDGMISFDQKGNLFRAFISLAKDLENV